MNYAAKDSSMYSSGVDALLTSTAANQPMVVGTTDGNTENTVYMMITTDSPSENKYFNEYQTNAEIFNDSVNYFKGVAETIKLILPTRTSIQLCALRLWQWITYGIILL